MNQTVQLLMRDAGMQGTLSSEQRDAKLQQFMQDAYAMEKQVAYVSLILVQALWYAIVHRDTQSALLLSIDNKDEIITILKSVRP